MMVPLNDLRYWGFFSLGLLSLLLLMGALVQWWRNRTMARGGERLTGTAPSPRLGRGLTDRLIRWLHVSPEVGQMLARLPGVERYDRLLQQTGWPLRSTEALTGTAVLAVVVLLLATLARWPLHLSLLVTLAAVLALQTTLIWKRNHRATQLERQLPDALSLVARSMQAGHAFSSALQIAAQESPAPMGPELRSVFNEIQYGESPNEALSNWAQRVAGEDVRIFVIAVRIQSETGGNLAELLNQTAALIRERQKLLGTVRVLSAEGRISAKMLTLLPFGLAGLLNALNPAFMAQLWTTSTGERLLTVALTQMGIGVLWMWRLVRVQP
jgi:tight adherence protein B